MPGYTYLTDQEAQRGLTVPTDKELDELLQEVRGLTGQEWIIRTHDIYFRRHWWSTLEHRYHYTLYWYTGHGIEYQVINLRTPGGGSVFGGSTQSACDIANYLMGVINGWQDAEKR